MKFRNGSFKAKSYIISGYFILWVVLFEFIFPVNKILPKPSVVLLSLPDLFKVYHLGESILSSVSSVYLPLAFAWIVLWICKNILVGNNNYFTHFFNSFQWFSKYVPGIILSLLIVYWFPHTEYMKYIFIFLISFASLVMKLRETANSAPVEYIYSAMSLGYKNVKQIKWKHSEPELAEHSVNLHLYLWSMLLIFEYIKGGFGLGSVYRTALMFNDISGLFTSIIITGVIVWLGGMLLNFYRQKYFFWK